LELVDTDFAHDKAEGWARHQRIVDGWRAVPKSPIEGSQTSPGLKLPPTSARTRFYQPVHLLRRSWIKSYRDLIAYWIRVGMYTCERLSHTSFPHCSQLNRPRDPRWYLLASTRSLAKRCPA
jgi:hypothetical protein